MYMGWSNSDHLAKFFQSKPKKWNGSDNWLSMDYKNEKSIKKNQVLDNTGFRPKKSIDPVVLWFFEICLIEIPKFNTPVSKTKLYVCIFQTTNTLL
jgi:hypothetical protein